MNLLDNRFIRFGLVGFMATAVHVTIMVSLIEIAGVNPVLASVPAFLVAMFSGFIANRHWTFASKSAHHKQLVRYFFVSIMGLGLNVGITFIVVDVLKFWYGLALAIVVIVVPVLTFIMNRDWTFYAGH